MFGKSTYGFHSASSLIAMIFLCCSGIALLPVLKFLPNRNWRDAPPSTH